MITLAIPNYNRSEQVINSFIKVISDPRIDEIVICDDFSKIETFYSLSSLLDYNKSINPDFNKVRLIRNSSNLGSFFNKKECVINSKNDWVILLDSDNSLDIDYIDVVSNLNDINTLYAPSHAVCDSTLLNYTQYSNTELNLNSYIDKIKLGRSIWDCILNTGNYFFNKKTYLKCIDSERNLLDSYAADAYYLIYLWFKNIKDSKFLIVDGLKYNHHLSLESHWLHSSTQSDNFINDIINRVNSWS